MSVDEHGWESIETLPKSGCKVDVWANGERHPDCCWISPTPLYSPRTGKYETLPPRLCEWAVIDYDGVQGWDSLEGVVTHWRYPPKPPVVEPANNNGEPRCP